MGNDLSKRFGATSFGHAVSQLLCTILVVGLIPAAAPTAFADSVAASEVIPIVATSAPPDVVSDCSEPPAIALSLDHKRTPNDILAKHIAEAKRSVWAVVYKFNESDLLDGVRKARERGVEVRMVVDGHEAGRKRSNVKKARDMGVEIRKWKDDKLHAKFVIIDGVNVHTGSYNWTKSAQENVELLIEFECRVIAKRFEKLFEELWADAKP